MKTNSNSYTIIYSVVLVLVVAFLLAFVSQALKALQDANVRLDHQKQILFAQSGPRYDQRNGAETVAQDYSFR